ncbi:membrane or secreted protein [Maribacter sp. ACAM166]|uniref:membrane or secreted protein n=1 Tax=Maribacter sp. ACAM166 TaxID=2508996 RepID=UPI0010FDEA51|nr:membrane or secreted protein [Maribacter sp. ACAM166]TLP79066.1 membrane or secreted protein [Maribacter sp. ACAM166]
MKKIMVVLICTLIPIGIKAQSVIGAWESYVISENGDKLRNVVIFADGYQVLTTYNATTGKFIHSNGGTWKLEGDTMTEKVEFHTDNSERVGTEVRFKVIIADSIIEIVDSNLKLNRIDNGEPGKLQGAWLMSDRIREGKTQFRDTSSPRKTMKIVSGTRFQWIAYNTETKQFIGTGGGTYTTLNGAYTDNIEFFSKDDSKVGITLKFKYKLTDGKWNHKGLSSTGNLINEIWNVRK